ncbi:MAG: DUF4446 family protein [Armatimonadota bacterium]|nr:DUF4446 family protein [Armatimonadota bacterium]
MELLNTATDFVSENETLILLCMSVLVLALLILSASLIRKVRRLSRTTFSAVDGETGQLLSREIARLAKDLSALSGRMDNGEQMQAALKAQQDLCLQRIGFVRYDAFDDIGGEQSFVVALLNAENSGVVLSNLYSRVDSRMYAKRINTGTSEHALSTEEQQAVEKAEP